MFYWIAIEIIFLIRIVGQIIQLLNKENNYGLIIIRISNVLGILLIALAFIQNPIHEMNRVKDKYWNYYSIYLVTVFIDLILYNLRRSKTSKIRSSYFDLKKGRKVMKKLIIKMCAFIILITLFTRCHQQNKLYSFETKKIDDQVILI